VVSPKTDHWPRSKGVCAVIMVDLASMPGVPVQAVTAMGLLVGYLDLLLHLVVVWRAGR
jgi:hypothetical protein